MTDDVIAAALADAESVSTPEDKLGIIGKWVQEQMRLEDLVESLTQQLSLTNKLLEDVRDFKLPEAMKDANCSKFVTEDGAEVKAEVKYYANVTKDEESQFYDYLEEANNDGIINADIKLTFGKGGRAAAKKFLEELKELVPDMAESYSVSPPPVELSQSIHWATLRAFAKEQTEQGTTIPFLKVHSITSAKIKRKKEK